jgi:hypothetical protein
MFYSGLNSFIKLEVKFSFLKLPLLGMSNLEILEISELIVMCLETLLLSDSGSFCIASF